MAPGITSGTLVFIGVFMLIIACYPISGSRVRYQDEFKQLDKFESMKAQQPQPDIIILQKESEAPLGSYIPQAIQESNELMSEILSDLQPMRPIPQKQLVWKKKKRWAPHQRKGNFFKIIRRARFVKDVGKRAKPSPVSRHRSSSRKFNKSSNQSKLSRRLKRSLSSSHKKETALDDTFLKMLKTMGEKISKRRQAEILLKRREAEATEDITVKTDHLTLTALKTQQKLSEMVDHLSDPSNDMSKEEKLSYMHELLNELQLFSKMLQQQILMQSLNEVQDLTSISTPTN